jgi:hypothetical protein
MSTPADPVKLTLDYAWNWFSYHAGQRFAAFNFFIVVVGAEAVAYADAATNRSRVLGVGVAALGACLAAGLFMIDVRNAKLVRYGRTALMDLEAFLGVSIATAADQRPLLTSHDFWLRAILFVSGVLSILAAIWAINGF